MKHNLKEHIKDLQTELNRMNSKFEISITSVDGEFDFGMEVSSNLKLRVAIRHRICGLLHNNILIPIDVFKTACNKYHDVINMEETE